MTLLELGGGVSVTAFLFFREGSRGEFRAW